jgi:hypothetical protein
MARLPPFPHQRCQTENLGASHPVHPGMPVIYQSSGCHEPERQEPDVHPFHMKAVEPI